MMAQHIAAGHYSQHAGDVLDLPADFAKVDLVMSYMVMEHVKDDVGFIRGPNSAAAPPRRLKTLALRLYMPTRTSAKQTAWLHEAFHRCHARPLVREHGGVLRPRNGGQRRYADEIEMGCVPFRQRCRRSSASLGKRRRDR